jgi:hypothetical protein
MDVSAPFFKTALSFENVVSSQNAVSLPNYRPLDFAHVVFTSNTQHEEIEKALSVWIVLFVTDHTLGSSFLKDCRIWRIIDSLSARFLLAVTPWFVGIIGFSIKEALGGPAPETI